MKHYWVGLTIAALLAGCGTPASSTARTGSPASAGAAAGSRAVAKPKPAAPPSGRYPEVMPISVVAGKVVLVNAELRFVVVDFGFGALPSLQQRLNVYRQGVKVGELKLSGQVRNSNAVADITAGEARAGDEVRTD